MIVVDCTVKLSLKLVVEFKKADVVVEFKKVDVVVVSGDLVHMFKICSDCVHSCKMSVTLPNHIHTVLRYSIKIKSDKI